VHVPGASQTRGVDQVDPQIRDRSRVGQDRAVVRSSEHHGHARRPVRVHDQPADVDPSVLELVPQEASELVVAHDAAESDAEPEPRRAGGDDRAGATDGQVRPVDEPLGLSERGLDVPRQHEVGVRVAEHEEIERVGHARTIPEGASTVSRGARLPCRRRTAKGDGPAVDAEIARQRYEREHDPSRVLALSDGVIAIIITLLVLEIHVPKLESGETLGEALQQVRPSFFAFFLSFVVVAISWAGHRDLFALIRRTDRLLVWLNILFLLPLCIIPFGASMLASYENAAIALQMYGALLLAAAATRLGIWWYATGRPHLLHEPIDAPSRRAGVWIVVGPASAYLAAILVAAPAPAVSRAIYAVVPVAYFVLVWRVRHSAPPGAAERDFT
jgi:uncharacterized membrane protein